MKTKLFSLLVLTILVLFFVPPTTVKTAPAANGDLVGTVMFAEDCASGLGVGITFDGTNLWFSCTTSATDLYKANPTSGEIIASYNLFGDLGALSYDVTRNVIWGAVPPNQIYKINLDSNKNVTGTTFGFTVNHSCGIIDGLALDVRILNDPNDDVLFYSDDCLTNTIDVYSISGGVPLESFPWGGNACYNSGLAIGGELLYEGSDGCSHVWVVDKVTKSPAFDFSTVIAGDPNFRDEDLTCDTKTFASQGKHVMWSKEAYSPNRAHAFEIPFNSCGVGGSAALYDFKQNRNADGSLTEWAGEHMYDINSCATMAQVGCAVTALTDILASYNLIKLPNFENVDPGTVNRYLGLPSNGSSHTGCYIIWANAGKSLNHTIHDYRPPTTSYEQRIARIDEALQANNLVIVGFPNVDGKHFVVFYQKAPNAPDGSPDYYIADPYRYPPYATGDRSGKSLYQAYNKTLKQMASSFQVEVMDNKSPEPGRTWVIVAHSPVEMLITDSNGQRTGYDPETGTYVLEIPDSSYGPEDGIVDDTGVEPTLPEVLYFGQNSLENGTYKVEVIGTGSGQYELDFAVANGPMDTEIQSISGTTTPGQIDTYLVKVEEDQPIEIQSLKVFLPFVKNEVGTK